MFQSEVIHYFYMLAAHDPAFLQSQSGSVHSKCSKLHLCMLCEFNVHLELQYVANYLHISKISNFCGQIIIELHIHVCNNNIIIPHGIENIE